MLRVKAVTEQVKVKSVPAKPVVLFDGDCNFCRRWIARWQEATGDRVEYTPYQDTSVAERFAELKPEQMAEAVHLVTPDGVVYRGAAAVFRSLDFAPGWRFGSWAYRRLPGFAGASDIFYRFVARHRMLFSRLKRLLWGAHVERPKYRLVRSLFLRGLGVVYLIAFLSLWTQVLGLIGEQGIIPAKQTMKAVGEAIERNQIGLGRYHVFPTLCWWDASDGALQFQCGAGAVLALLLIVGVAPAPCLILLWVLYLSLTTVSGVFLGYQWDNLLLEAGLLAIFFAPLRWLGGARGSAPSAIALWLLRWLLFRLMFLSGCVKLLSGDSMWKNLTALNVHYETQPLPTWIGWYAHQLPESLQRVALLIMFAIEVGLPFLIFLPRRARFLACGGFIFLQIVIALTGNYTFFNLLTVVLCFLLLDDAAIRNMLPVRWRFVTPMAGDPTRGQVVITRMRNAAVALLAAAVITITAIQLAATFRKSFPNVPLLVKFYEVISPFRSINSYGLFAVMTTTRPEIIVEGSNDGQTWLAYEFKHKPGALDRPPDFVAPYQPRVDWQMWFAALGRYRDNPWFMRFCQRLLEGSPEVVALLEKNPFPKAPPRYVRATVYEYHFTTRAERAKTGNWWKREYKRPYCPVISIK